MRAAVLLEAKLADALKTPTVKKPVKVPATVSGNAAPPKTMSMEGAFYGA